jgi:hypothetical protein
MLFAKFSVIRFLGGYTGGVTPVPIPNTEVKLSRADDTMIERSWESRTLPGIFLSPSSIDDGLFFVLSTQYQYQQLARSPVDAR